MVNRDAIILIEAIKKSDIELNDWETKFMASIEQQVVSVRKLSLDQGNKLQEIYRKSQGGGFWMQRENKSGR